MKIMEIDKLKKYWKEEDKRISESVNINRGVSFQKFRSSFNRIKTWRFVRIVQWFIVMPLLFTWGILPNMKNDGSGLFYVALVLLIIIMMSFCVSYVYHYIYLSKIDFAESISKVQQKILRSEMLDKKIYLFRFVSMLVAFLCAFKLFGTPVIGSEKITILALTAFIMVYVLIVRLKFLIPKDYTKVKSCLDEMEDEEKEH